MRCESYFFRCFGYGFFVLSCCNNWSSLSVVPAATDRYVFVFSNFLCIFLNQQCFVHDLSYVLLFVFSLFNIVLLMAYDSFILCSFHNIYIKGKNCVFKTKFDWVVFLLLFKDIRPRPFKGLQIDVIWFVLALLLYRCLIIL